MINGDCGWRRIISAFVNGLWIALSNEHLIINRYYVKNDNNYNDNEIDNYYCYYILANHNDYSPVLITTIEWNQDVSQATQNFIEARTFMIIDKKMNTLHNHCLLLLFTILAQEAQECQYECICKKI